jgi:hypothetical protein
LQHDLLQDDSGDSEFLYDQFHGQEWQMEFEQGKDWLETQQ